MAEQKPLPVFLTGASRGIGAATAREFAYHGHPLALVARSAERIAALAKEIEDKGGRALALPCDVADAKAVGQAVERAAAALGELGIVVNNAGTIEPIAAIEDADPAAWARAIAVNLGGPIYVMHHAARHMAQGGAVINVTSGAAEHPQFGRSAYCASKAGLMIASRVFAVEEAEKRGLRVIGFSPGLVDTEMNAYNRANRMGNGGNIDVAQLRPAAETARLIHYLCRAEAADYSGKIANARDPELRRRAGVPAL